MARNMFDVHDAASRFFHLKHAMETGLEALSPANVDTGNLDSFPEGMRDDIIKSRVIMAGVQQRFFMQSMTATVYATFEYCMVSSLRNYEIECEIETPLAHGPGVNLGTVAKKLDALGYDYVAAENATLLELAREIRNCVMHRGGLILASQKEKFLSLAKRSYFVELLPFADGNELEQIEIGAPFLRALIADCEKLLAAVHDRLCDLLRTQRSPAGVAH